jgi:hypothetical protein
MDLKTEDSFPINVVSTQFRETLVVPVVSGPESHDRVIDLKLSGQIETIATAVRVVSTIIAKEPISLKSEWSKLRSRFSGGAILSGWYYPALKGEEENENNSLTNIELQENINDEVKKLLTETIGLFTENAGIFKDNLGELKQEIQTLPIFQGALTSLNTSVLGQSSELKELKYVCDSALKLLIEKQEEVTEVVKKISNQSKIDFNAEGLSELDIKFDGFLSSFENMSKSNSESLNLLKEQFKILDTNRFQLSLETIYKAVKKSIEENRERSLAIFKSLQQILNMLEQNNAPEREHEISELRLEIVKSSLIVERFEKKFDNLKRKMTFAYYFAMASIGVLIGSCLNLF